MNPGDTTLGGRERAFPETVGVLIGRVAHPRPEDREAAFADFCRGYWKPVYYYFRAAWAKSNEDAKDLAQAFFLWLYETNPLEKYRRDRGGFRAYLKSLLKHFVQHQEEAVQRLKRGGHIQFVRMDQGDDGFAGDLAVPSTGDPEKIFDEAWRNDLVDQAVERVRRRYQESGRAICFQVFQDYDLAAPEGRPTYDEVAARLGLKKTDVHNYLVAVREDIRSEIRRELERRSDGPEELEEEWNDFFSTS